MTETFIDKSDNIRVESSGGNLRIRGTFRKRDEYDYTTDIDEIELEKFNIERELGIRLLWGPRKE